MRIGAGLIVVLLVVAGCASSDPTASEEYQTLEQELATAELRLTDTEAQLAAITAERDEFAAQAVGGSDRYAKSLATAERIAEIIDDPDAIGTREEVLDELMTMAVSWEWLSFPSTCNPK